MRPKAYPIQKLTKSILRYPGSKARLASYIADTIATNGYSSCLFVEPFCGGASVSIALLEAGIAEEIIINDLDPIVASLWECIFSKSEAAWLSDAVMNVPLTLSEWERQKALVPSTTREAALKCLYLNRTSFSGVLHKSAGPIGGKSQQKWTVGCRFNREKLATRIAEISQLSERVRAVTCTSWQEVCVRWAPTANTFFYLDPPFFKKAERLYRFVFSSPDHVLLSTFLQTFDRPWVLSYDNDRDIRLLYDQHNYRSKIVNNTYSTHPVGGNSVIGREILYTNLKKLPSPSHEIVPHVGISIHPISKSTSSRLNSRIIQNR